MTPSRDDFKMGLSYLISFLSLFGLFGHLSNSGLEGG